MRGQPQPGLRRFIGTTASMRSLSGPFGPGRRRCLEAKTTCGTFVCAAHCEDAAEWKPHNDGGTKDTCREHEQRAQTGDDPIDGRQVGCMLASAIEDQQLMPDQHGLGDNGTESTQPCRPGQGDDQMNEYNTDVAHPGNSINTSKPTALRPNIAIRYRQVSVPMRTRIPFRSINAIGPAKKRIVIATQRSTLARPAGVGMR